MKCRNCSYHFDPLKEGNTKKRKCGMCYFGDSYSVRSKKEYERNLLIDIFYRITIKAPPKIFSFHLKHVIINVIQVTIYVNSTIIS